MMTGNGLIQRYMKGEQLDRSTSSELVALAVANHFFFKDVAAELEKRPSDAVAAEVLVQSFRDRRAPAWLTAHLLGCLRDLSGYAVAREILWAAPGDGAETYAGVAMARIAGLGARKDLLEAVETAPHHRSRQGAAYGLGELREGNLARVLLEAVRAGRIRKDTAAGIVASLPDPEARLLEWLAAADALTRDVALRGAFFLTARAEGLGSKELAHSVDHALKSGVGPLSPRIRRLLEERIAALL